MKKLPNCEYDAQYCLFDSNAMLGEVFVITGKLSVSRATAVKAIRQAGGAYRTTVSQNTTCLVVGVLHTRSPDGLSKKYRTALAINATREKQIRIIGEEGFYKMLQEAVDPTCGAVS